MIIMRTLRFFKGQFFADAGNTSDPTWIWCDESKLLFEVLKALCFRTSAIHARGCKHVLIYGRNTTTKQKTYYVVVRKTEDSIRRSGTDCGVAFISKVERQRLRNQIDSSMQRYLEWLSINRAEYFAEERPQSTSSSSWTPSSSWWTSSSWTSDWHQHEWQDSGWSEKWQDETSTQEVDLGTRKLEARFRTPSWKLSTSTPDRRLNIFFVVQDFNNWDALVVDL